MEQLCFCQRDGLDISIPTFSFSRALPYVIVNLFTQGWVKDLWKGVHMFRGVGARFVDFIFFS